jgi:hypothetical protein
MILKDEDETKSTEPDAFDTMKKKITVIRDEMNEMTETIKKKTSCK